jgi:hypothetical protein
MLNTQRRSRNAGSSSWNWYTAGIEPAATHGATLGLGPELALELLRGLLRDAEELGDDTLAKGITVYQSRLALVLAQQGVPVSVPGEFVAEDGSSIAEFVQDTLGTRHFPDKPNPSLIFANVIFTDAYGNT